MKNIKKMTKKTKKEEYYSENGFVYDDTGYDNLYLINIDITFDSDFIYSIIME